MRILLLGHDDLASLYALDRLLGRLAPHELEVMLSGPLAGPSSGALARLARIDAGLCRQFLETADPRLARARALPRPNAAEGVDALRELDPHLVVSVRYRRILREPAIRIPRHGVINLHSGLLPDYKGVMATFWAMLNDEPEIGCTLHRIVDSGIDTGPVLDDCRRPTDFRKSYLANVLGLYGAGCERVVAAIAAIAEAAAPASGAPPLRGIPQDPAAGRYYSTPDAQDVERFLARGLVLVDGGELEGLDGA